jgi:manganese/zinc/iron transport system substrate-binding protein
MKRLLFSFLMLFGCSQSTDHVDSPMDRFMANNGKLKVLSTTGIISDLVSQIGGECIDHVTLIAGELDPHSYELVKGDDEKLKFAELIFYHGLGLEHGASLQYALEHHSGAVSLGDVIRESSLDAMIAVDATVDPHVWMDMSLWVRTVDTVVETLSARDPSCAKLFEENGRKVRVDMEQRDQRIYTMLQGVPEEKRYLVTSHDAFNYFTRRYLSNPGENWRPRFAAPEGLSPEGQLSTSHIAEIINHLAHYCIGVVFPESNVSRDSLKKIVLAGKEKGLTVKISEHVLYGDALGSAESGAETYLKMMEHNATVLLKEWE